MVGTLVTDTLEEPANSCFLPTVRNARRLLADGDVQTILVENIESLRENSLQRLVDGYFTLSLIHIFFLAEIEIACIIP